MSAGVPDEIIRGNGEIAASLPHLLGYRPGDQTVVVVGLVGLLVFLGAARALRVGEVTEMVALVRRRLPVGR